MRVVGDGFHAEGLGTNGYGDPDAPKADRAKVRPRSRRTAGPRGRRRLLPAVE